MTRNAFDALFVEQYEPLVAYACKKIGQHDGRDCVHQAYANIIEHQVYKKKAALGQGKRIARWWLYLKVAREIVRYRVKEQLRHAKERESGDETVSY